MRPDELALHYIANSTIIKYLTELDVDLDLFYRLLWRHIFAVEFIRMRYKITTEAKRESFLQVLRTLRVDKNKAKALDYFNDWGDKFWESTECRVKEVTRTFESKISAQLGGGGKKLTAGVSGADGSSLKERAEFQQRAQEIVNSIQIKDLSKVIEILADDLMKEPQPKYFIVIDGLDEGWVDDIARYRLIRALVETIRDFRRIRSAKIVIALRQDLLERVVRQTRDAGFQEEKYQSLYLPLQWNKKQMFALLDKRVNKVVKRQYTGGAVHWHQLMPVSVDGLGIAEYILQRTLYRPRDLIQFFNQCIQRADGHPEITVRMLRDAEADYSRLRLRALADEWWTDYPELMTMAEILKHGPINFSARDTIEKSEELGLALAIDESKTRGAISRFAQDFVNGNIDSTIFNARVISALHHVGLVGVKNEPHFPMAWTFLGAATLRPTELRETASVKVCPAFHRILNVGDR